MEHPMCKGKFVGTHTINSSSEFTLEYVFVPNSDESKPDNPRPGPHEARKALTGAL